MWLVVFCATLFIGLEIGLGIGLLFSLFCVVLQTILWVLISSLCSCYHITHYRPYSPELGEASEWTFPCALNNKQHNYNIEDMKVKTKIKCFNNIVIIFGILGSSAFRYIHLSVQCSTVFCQL